MAIGWSSSTRVWSQGRLLSAGDVLSYSFNTLPFSVHTTIGYTTDMAFCSVVTDATGLSRDGLLRYELFENRSSTEPFLDRTIPGSGSPSALLAQFSGPWNDLEGRVQITMLSGTVRVLALSLSSAKRADGIGGFDVFSTRVHMPIPEPEGLNHVVTVLVGFLWCFARRAAPRLPHKGVIKGSVLAIDNRRRTEKSDVNGTEDSS